jgi:SAM-dependent methyltransferase
MRDNVREFVRLVCEALTIPEPVVEIGARQAAGQEGLADLRPMFPGEDYIGCDLESGPGVDLLADTHNLGFAEGSVGAVILVETLEHIEDPLQALREVHRILRPEGVALATSSMNFPIHSFPADYWRFTPSAFDLLFEPFDAKAVFYQGDPDFPRTVLGIAWKAANLEKKAALEHAADGLQAMWPETVPAGPLIRFEPLIEAAVLDRPDRVLPEITGADSVSQTFRCPRDMMTRIDLKFATHGRSNEGRITLSLEQEDDGLWKPVGESRFHAVHVENRVWMPFRFPRLVDSEWRRYRMTLTSSGAQPGRAVSPYASDELSDVCETLSVNGEPQAGALCFRILCRAEEPASRRSHSWAPRERQRQRQRPRQSTEAQAARMLAQLQSDQLWYVASRVQERVDQLIERLEAIERRISLLQQTLNEVVDFLRRVRSSPPYTLLRSLFRRSGRRKSRQ